MRPKSFEISLVCAATLALWLGCLAVGVGGGFLRYPRPAAPAKEPPPVLAQVVNVEVTSEPLPPETAPRPPPEIAEFLPPPMAEPDIAPKSPPLAPVAVPSPAISFELPVEGPARVVEPKQAAPVPQAPNAPVKLTYGQGEGKQPAPEYPREAVLARQEGTVVVRFTVAADGHVTSAEASVPCPSALLNQAAVRAVRENWRFPSGLVRVYEVSIQFQLVRR